MADNEIKDLEFDISECMLDPFKGVLAFTVRKKIKITNFEFSTHAMGCHFITGRSVKYGVRLRLNGEVLFTYYRNSVDVQVKKNLILEPGKRYELETWLGSHIPLKSGRISKSCLYHYAQITRSDVNDYEPFDFIFGDNEDDYDEPSNKTCIYVIEYKIVD